MPGNITRCSFNYKSTRGAIRSKRNDTTNVILLGLFLGAALRYLGLIVGVIWETTRGFKRRKRNLKAMKGY